MSVVLIPIATLVLGAFLGFLSTLYLASQRHRNEIQLRIIDQYLAVRKELAEVASKLTYLEKPLGDSERLTLQETVAAFFYKHYDFLPVPVLDSLALLRVTLSKYDGVVYGVKDKAILPLAASEVARFIDGCSHFRNAKLSAPIALAGRDTERRAREAVKLQAKNLLTQLNTYVSIEDFLALPRQLKKTTAIRSREVA